MPVAKVSFPADGFRIDIELPMHKVSEHAVEGSIHSPNRLVQPGIAQDDTVKVNHEGEQDDLQPTVIER